MSQCWFTHASPTLFNAGTPRPQLSSCFPVCMKYDNIEGIYDTLKECSIISKSVGGIRVSVHNIRATSNCIWGTNGISNGKEEQQARDLFYAFLGSRPIFEKS